MNDFIQFFCFILNIIINTYKLALPFTYTI